jgi:thiamine-phosphate pyrophosphorylase
MNRSWTPAVARAVEVARACAQADAAAEVLPLHLLQGLLAEDEGRAVALAVAAGLRWHEYAPASAPPLSPDPDLPLHDDTARILHAARHLALEMTGDSTVASEIVLLVLLRSHEDVRAGLEQLGFRLDRLEAELDARKPPPLDLDEPLRLLDATEQLDLARILDACANRAREGLRALEDYCRFVLDDAFLCGELKRLRHDLTVALAAFPAAHLLAARDTLGDVGVAITTPSETHRYGLFDVVQASAKRLQEALRSLEEYAKVRDPATGAALEQLRYRAYTLERAIVGGASARDRLRDARLCVLVSASLCKGPLERTVREAIAGGAPMIQLREKGLDDRALLALAREVRRWTRELGALFIVNDRPDIARLVEADGVHLGQDDLPVREARRIVGPDALVGVSTHDLDQVRRAVLDGASYLGVGPTFPSATKDFPALAGLAFVRAASAETALPAFAIGGIHQSNLGAVLAAGARRVAVGHAIAQSDDPRSATAQLLFALAASA